MFAWEEDLLEQLKADIQHVHLSQIGQDSWRWKHTSSGVFSVKSAYQLLVSESTSTDKQVYNLIWGSKVPTKVAAFCWKLVQNKIPTMVNLQKRGVQLGGGSNRCPFCSSKDETEDHLFLLCAQSAKIWKSCDQWWNISTARAATTKDHLLQHRDLVNGSRLKEVWVQIWITIIWSIWIKRNNVIFRGMNFNLHRVMDLIQLRSWFWLRGKYERFHCLLSEWILDPRACAKSLS